MIDTRNTTNDNQNSKLVKIVFGLIDSKIQFIEHQQAFLCSTFHELDEMSTETLELVESTGKLKKIKSRLDDFIQKTEKLTHAHDLLMIIRSFIKEETARAIFELLTNDKYLFYTSGMLQRMLNLETYMAEHYYSRAN
ncbi:MAG: hypothetical protein AAGG75_12420 [Bacteroidota bacterium]